MKKSLAFTLLWVIALPVTAQKQIEKSISFSGKESVELTIEIADSIIINTWNKPEVLAKASININNNKDNDAYRTTFSKEGDNIIISASIEKDYFRDKNSYCCREGMIKWKINIPENTPFSVETINGNVTIAGSTTEVRVKTISGFIDWEVTPGRKADLEMNTTTGTLYSDLEFDQRIMEGGVQQSVSEKLNGGGYPVELETITGDIFCRKSN